MKRLDNYTQLHPAWAEGPSVLPAQGNALGIGAPRRIFVGPTGQPFSKGELLARWAGIFFSFFRFPGRCPGLGERPPLRGFAANG